MTRCHHTSVHPFPVRDALLPLTTSTRQGRWCWECERAVYRRPAWADAMRDLCDAAELDRLHTQLRRRAVVHTMTLLVRARCRICQSWTPVWEVSVSDVNHGDGIARMTRDVAYLVSSWARTHAQVPSDATSGKLLPSTPAQWAHLGLKVDQVWTGGRP